jgi:hypothetical protein
VSAPEKYQGEPVPEAIATLWRSWEGAAWRKGVHYSHNELYPPDQRFFVLAPGGMCKRHLEMRRGYRDMYFDDRSGNRWPGTSGSPFTIIGRDLARELAWRRQEWDEKASEQMRAIEELCLAGRSPQCDGPRTCLACRRMVCTCPEAGDGS